MWLSAQSPSPFCFPEAHITVLAVQLDPPPSWLFPFLFFMLVSDYYQMPAACPALCAAVTAPISLGIPQFPSGRLLMLVCIFVFRPCCCLILVLLTAASSLLLCHCLPQTLVVTAVTSLPCLPQQRCVLSRCPASSAAAAGKQY